MTTNEMPCQTLEGLGVLVTRAAHQADHLCKLIEARDGRVFRLPALEIVPSSDSNAVTAIRKRLPEYNLVIFISVNAARMAVSTLFPVGGWPPDVKIAAVGKQTATAINDAGLSADVVPEDRFTSEALLTLGSMHEVSGSRILIVRGEGGREHLADTLKARGASVDYAEVYRRAVPEVDTRPVMDAWAQGSIDAVTVSSRESLNNLHTILGETGQRYLKQARLVVGSLRSAELAEQLGHTLSPVIAANASDEAMVEALEQWWSMH